MRKRTLIVSVSIIALIAVIIDAFTPPFASSFNSAECINSFYAYAYTGTPEQAPPDAALMPPWQAEARIEVDDAGPSIVLSVQAVRTYPTYAEIWVSANDLVANPESGMDRRIRYLVYRTDTREWRRISAAVSTSHSYVDQLYLAPDGLLWGRAAGRNEDIEAHKGFPLLSKYNPATEQFEPELPSRDIPAFYEYNTQAYRPNQVLLGADGVFWVLAEGEAIYSYDPAKQIAVRQVDLPEGMRGKIILAPDNSIFFEVYDLDYVLDNADIWLYSPQSGKLEALPSSLLGKWPGASIFPDRQGRLWISSVGWRNPDSTWEKIHPNTTQYFWQMEWVEDWNWRTPELFFESSDGRLWFRKMLDSSKANWGMAWYEPETERGCWFTTAWTNIVEDEQRNLWIVVGDVLYRYPLK